MAEQIKDFPIAHVYWTMRLARKAASDFIRERADEIKAHMTLGGKYRAILNNGEEHYFMSKKAFEKYWMLGRTYYINGVLCHSGYPTGTEGRNV